MSAQRETVLEDLPGMPRELYNPRDVDEAYDAWRAKCGPASLAAVLRRPVMSLQNVIEWPARGYSNITQIKGALDALGVGHRRTSIGPEPHMQAWPTYGLAMLQIKGPWERAAHIGAAYAHTHWIGVSNPTPERGGCLGSMVYDINATVDDDYRGGWMPLTAWVALVLPLHEEGRATGGVWCRSGIELVGMEGRGATPNEAIAGAHVLRDEHGLRPDQVAERLAGKR